MDQTLLRTFIGNHEALASVYSANETGTEPVQLTGSQLLDTFCLLR